MKHLIGKTLGGYQLLDLIGAGGMGAVFLARQISLDREVALKILPDRFAENAEALARFTREALSAAQLSHHNVVQVYDVGSDQGHHFISMEYVRGESLADMIRRDGRLQVDDAASYILQAARGLKHAHDMGIIHRDIKPDNLLLTEYGVVKIADMGLAKSVKDFERVEQMPTEEELKRADAEITLANRGLGTPAYMPPEQARDARSVDARADQYSLGCTLYYLCAGKAPYSGTTAFELITKHLNEPMTPLDAHIRSVPPVFEAIIERALAKEPADRYPDMGVMIDELETYLGVGAEEGGYRPREHHASALERSLEQFNEAPRAKIRRRVKQAALGIGLLAVLWSLLVTKSFVLAGGFVGLLILTPVFNFVVDGLATKSFLFRRVRSLYFGMPIKSWLINILGAAVLIAALWLLGWLGGWIAFAVVAAAVAVAHQFAVLRPLRAERQEPIAQMNKVLRELRLRGLSEEALQEFICKFSGVHWEEFFETLFGYEDMMSARLRWAMRDQITPRKRWATWRDPLVRWLERIEDARRAARERKTLAKAEARRLRAQGFSERDADRQANQEAEAFVAKASVDKAKARAAREIPDVIPGRAQGRSKIMLLFAVARGLVGLAIAAAALVQFAGTAGIDLPVEATGWLTDTYYPWGAGGNVIGLAVGALLFLTAFSSRLIGPVLTLIGALLVVGYRPVVDMIDQPQLTDEIAALGAAIIAAAGFALCILGKMGGGKF